jgi:mRNA-degrading endonuclease toxin of MazEF toxin-antitoxin module
VVNLTQIKTVDKHSLKEKIGSLTKERLADVYEGMKLIMDIH